MRYNGNQHFRLKAFLFLYKPQINHVGELICMCIMWLYILFFNKKELNMLNMHFFTSYWIFFLKTYALLQSPGILLNRSHFLICIFSTINTYLCSFVIILQAPFLSNSFGILSSMVDLRYFRFCIASITSSLITFSSYVGAFGVFCETHSVPKIREQVPTVFREICRYVNPYNFLYQKF